MGEEISAGMREEEKRLYGGEEGIGDLLGGGRRVEENRRDNAEKGLEALRERDWGEEGGRGFDVFFILLSLLLDFFFFAFPFFLSSFCLGRRKE